MKDKDQATIKCPFCSRLFKTSQGLSSHERWWHADELSCPVCGKYGTGGAACMSHFV